MEKIKNILELIVAIVAIVSVTISIYHSDNTLYYLHTYNIELFLFLFFIIGVILIVYFKEVIINIFSKVEFRFIKTILGFLFFIVLSLSLYQSYYYVKGFEIKLKLLPNVGIIEANNYFNKGNYKESISIIDKYIDMNFACEEYKCNIENTIKLKNTSLDLYKFLPLYSYKKMESLNILYKLTMRQNNDLNLSKPELKTPKLRLILHLVTKYNKDMRQNDDIFKEALLDIKNRRFDLAYNTLKDLKNKYPNNTTYILFYNDLKKIIQQNISINNALYIKDVISENNISDIVKKYKFNNKCYSPKSVNSPKTVNSPNRTVTELENMIIRELSAS